MSISQGDLPSTTPIFSLTTEVTAHVQLKVRGPQLVLFVEKFARQLLVFIGFLHVKNGHTNIHVHVTEKLLQVALLIKAMKMKKKSGVLTQKSIHIVRATMIWPISIL